MARLKIYEFTAYLHDFNPMISRRFQVVADMPLRKLAFILMILFEMRGGHLYEFNVPSFVDPTYSKRLVLPFELEEGGFPVDPKVVYSNMFNEKVNDVFLVENQQATFEYDYGDGWVIRLQLTGIIKKEDSRRHYPLLLEGKGYGIIEDVGGTGGLTRFMEAYTNKKGDEYKELRRWSGLSSFKILKFNHLDMQQRIRYLPTIYEKTQVRNEDPKDNDLNYLMHYYRF